MPESLACRVKAPGTQLREVICWQGVCRAAKGRVALPRRCLPIYGRALRNSEPKRAARNFADASILYEVALDARFQLSRWLLRQKTAGEPSRPFSSRRDSDACFVIPWKMHEIFASNKRRGTANCGRFEADADNLQLACT